MRLNDQSILSDLEQDPQAYPECISLPVVNIEPGVFYLFGETFSDPGFFKKSFGNIVLQAHFGWDAEIIELNPTGFEISIFFVDDNIQPGTCKYIPFSGKSISQVQEIPMKEE